MGWVGQRFIGPSAVLVAGNDAGRTGVDQFGDTLLAAAVNYILRTQYIRPHKRFPRTPVACLGRHVEHRLHPGASARYRRRILQIAPDERCPNFFKLRVVPPCKYRDLIATFK